MADLREQLQARLSGSYTLGRELSGGGMSRVFMAEDSVLGRAVVIKVLAPDLAAGLNAERFKREIMLAAQLQHPHIVPVLSAGVAEDLPYFVMPFVVGESLRNLLIGEAGLGTSDTVNVLRDVAKALSFAHDQGVIHRDIKPDNVLLAGGSAVVTDFGIAKAITSAATPAPGGTLTQVGTSLGTPAYMSPEQAAGDPNADARSDFYSFGVMAYEMIAGKPPFHDRATHALIMAHIAEPPEPIERLVPSVPPPLAHLVMRCLSKNPADRPQSAREILEDLDDVDLSGQRIRSGPYGTTGARSDQGMEAHRDTAAYSYADGTILMEVPPELRRRRSRKFPLLAAGSVALIAVAVFIGTRLMDGGSGIVDEHAMAVVPFRVASADPSHHYLREGMLDLIAAKLSGEELRAIEPRTVLDAWRSAGGTDDRDLSRDETLKLAGRLRAGKALLGDVVGTPDRLVLTVSLLGVPRGNQLSRVSVEGPPDSLGSLVNQIATQLMTQTSGEAARLGTLTSASLPALRAYLDGQAKLRRGDAVNAAKDFDRAVREDSTFALAGLGLRLATSWYGDADLGNRGLQIALRERERLSRRDQTLLTALAGPKYPEVSTNREIYDAREQYLAFAPENAEAWYLRADHIFHFGSAMGMPDWEERALAGFRKAMELDSLYLPGYNHAMPLAASLGDMAFNDRALALRSRADTTSFWRRQHTWYMAARAGDTETAERALNSSGPLREALLQGTVRHMQFDGTGTAHAVKAIDELVRLAPTDAVRRGRARYAHDVMLNMGRPREALRYVETSRDSAGDVNVDIIKVRDAIVGGGDRTAAAEAARALARIEARPGSNQETREIERAVVRVLEAWRLIQGDTSRTRPSLARLRGLARSVPPGQEGAAAIEIAYIEMLHARVTKSPSLRTTVERLDSMLIAQDFSGSHTGRTAQHTLAVAHAWEELGENRRALASALRYMTWNTEVMPYLATQVREVGRLAAAAGERKRAVRSYRHYLGMRSLGEPVVMAQVDSVRRELAAIEKRGD
ncbi:MAG: protein kinase domain-containing protein [Gemmatimonadaceae bacterium]